MVRFGFTVSQKRLAIYEKISFLCKIWEFFLRYHNELIIWKLEKI